MDEVLRIRTLAKAFAATQALKNISFDIARGEARALLGENGAGKSTCVKILNGLVRPDSGTIQLSGREYRPTGLSDAQKAGVSTAFQELSLIPDLSVAINMAMPNLPTNGVNLVRFEEVRRRAEKILTSYHISDIDPTALVSSLTLSEKQRLEIIRALSKNPTLLILDEPTAALTDVGWLYERIRALKAEGRAVLFITHRLKEARDLCERATILRNGEIAGTVELADASDNELFRLMIGRAMGTAFPRRPDRADPAKEDEKEKIVLSVEGLRSGSFGPATFSVRRGEIVGVAALEGQGQRALFNALAGIERITAGEVRIYGQLVKLRSPAVAKKRGISFVPEERKEEGLFFGLLTRANISISNIGRVGRWGLVGRKAEIEEISVVSAAVDLPSRYHDLPVDALSGGNQQKALIARALFAGAKCLLMFDPTRGVDVGTKQAIYSVIREAASEGTGILLYSTELRELTALSDRCVVVYGNRLVGECRSASLKEEELLERMHDTYAEGAKEELQGGREQRVKSL